MEKNRRTYSKEFKKRAVKLYLKGDHSQKQIAEDLGIDRSLLSSWCRAYGNKNAFPGRGNPQDKELYRARRELRDAKEERDILKKARAIFLSGSVTKYRFMEKHRNEFRVGRMAQVLEVSASGYYDWYRKGCQDRKEKDKPMIEEIKKVQEANRYRSGSPKVYRELNEAGIKIGHGKVERLMRENSLNCRTRKAIRTTTRADETKTPAPDVLKRDFTANAPDLKWVSDIVPSASGWLYLCVFIDLFSRRIIRWALPKRIDAQLVCDAFKEAMGERGAPEGVIVHSDRGSQYTSHAFRRMLKRSNAIQSMSRRGNPWDNAVAESFFSTVKT